MINLVKIMGIGDAKFLQPVFLIDTLKGDFGCCVKVP